MPTSAMPAVTVEIAFATDPFDASPTWEDVSDYVEAKDRGGPITIVRGRSDELSEIQPSTLTLTLDNSDGRFTPGNAAGAYYPNVKKGRRIRVSVVWNATTYRRFDGYVSEWPVDWPDGTTSESRVTITAASRFALLPRVNELRSVIEEELAVDAPTLQYPLNEPTDSLKASSTTATTNASQLSSKGTGTAFSFGNDTGPTTDGYTALHVAAGKYLGRTFSSPLVTYDTEYALEASFVADDTGAVRCVAMLSDPSVDSVAAILVDSFANGNRCTAEIRYPDGTTVTVATTLGPDVRDGGVHHAALVVTYGATSTDHALYVDGTIRESVSISNSGSGPSVPVPIPQMSVLNVGGGIYSSFLGSIAHVAFYADPSALDATRIGIHSEASLTGFDGERSDERIVRLARYAGIPDADVVTETGVAVVANQHTEGGGALDLMREVEVTERGLLYDGRDGTFRFDARSHRYDATPAAILDVELQQVEQDLGFKLDDQGLSNDVTATDTVEGSARATDDASVTAYGLYRVDLSVLTTTDDELQAAANARVNRYAEPVVRAPSASVALATLDDTALVTDLLTVDLGSCLELDNLPDQAPATTARFFVEGYTETISDESYGLSFNLSPAALSDVWVLGSSTYSVLGSTTRPA